MLVHERVLTNDACWHRGLASSARCPHCQGLLEDVLHVIRECPKAKEIGYGFYPQGMVEQFLSLPLRNWFFMNLICQQESRTD